jgi:hypothetical protein
MSHFGGSQLDKYYTNDERRLAVVMLDTNVLDSQTIDTAVIVISKVRNQRWYAANTFSRTVSDMGRAFSLVKPLPHLPYPMISHFGGCGVPTDACYLPSSDDLVNELIAHSTQSIYHSWA